MPNLPKIGSEVQKMAKNVKLQLKASYFRKVREKNNFYFGILAPKKHFQTNCMAMERNPPKLNFEL